jgi:hypothetical protein
LARIHLRLVEGIDAPYKSIQESLAIEAWRKKERVDLLRTIALVTASANPEKAQDALRRLIEEQFPEVAKDRERAVDRAMEIMEKEKTRSYSVAPVGHSLSKKGPWRRIQNILRQKRRRRRA